MGIKTVTMTIKRFGKAHSWQGDRFLPARLIDPHFFGVLENPSSPDPLFSSEPSIRAGFLGGLEACRTVPGTSGWIGVDVDRKVVWDAQAYWGRACEFEAKAYQAQLSLPLPALRALTQGPWLVQSFAYDEDKWTRFEALPEVDAWQSQRPTIAKRLEKLALDAGCDEEYNSLVNIRPSLPPGWRLISGLHPTSEASSDAHRFARLLRLLQSPGWGWDDDLWPAWKEHATDYRNLSAPQINALEAQFQARDLDRVLPCAPSKPGSPRF